MADGNIPAGDPAGQGAIPAKPADPSTLTPVSDSKGLGEAGSAALEIERKARAEVESANRALKKQLADIEKAKSAETQKALEEQGQYKQLADQYKTALDKTLADLAAQQEVSRAEKINTALSDALGSKVASGLLSSTRKVLREALTVGDDGKVGVDPVKIAALDVDNPLDAAKVRDLQTFVAEFLDKHPAAAASKTTGGAGSGGIGLVNGSTNYPAIWANWANYTNEQQQAFIADPGFQKAVFGK